MANLLSLLSQAGQAISNVIPNVYVNANAQEAVRVAEANLLQQQQITNLQKSGYDVTPLLGGTGGTTTQPTIPTPPPNNANNAGNQITTNNQTTNNQIQGQGAITLEQTIPNVKPFSYPWVEETQSAYKALEPFYQKLLDFAGGKMDLAKRMLEYTYQQGIRENAQEYEKQTGEYKRLFPQEIASVITSLNKRGAISSGFGQQERGFLGESQAARQLAVERARENRESRLTNERGFGIEEAGQTLEKTKFDLERQKRSESEQMALSNYGIKSDQFRSQLEKQQQEEARRAQNVTTSMLGGIASGSTTGNTTQSATSKPPEPTGPIITKGGATGKVADTTGRLYGGWYSNPATGKVQQYWGNNYWT